MNREAEFIERIEDLAYDLAIHVAEHAISKQAVTEWEKINDSFRYAKEAKRCARMANSLEKEKLYLKDLRVKLKTERDKK